MLGLLIMLTTCAVAQPEGVSLSETPSPAAQMSYDAIEPKNKRKAPAIKHGSEDRLLEPSKRSKLLANARDIRRNYAVASWMVRKHLDYVSTFDFNAFSGDEGFDRELEAFIEEWGRPYNCDAAGRHGLHKLGRLAEAHRTIDGDVGLMKLASGQIQAIEGDRVRNPMGHGAFMPTEPKNGAKWVHGVKVNEAGRALAYALHRRTGINAYEFERTVPAGNMCWFGYYDRIDQVRGISPIASALNPLRDTYEAMDYALIKAKVTQLFALAFSRKADDSAGDLTGGADDNGDEKKAGYSIDFGNGSLVLDLDPGDDAKFLESQHPSTEFQSFLQVSLMIALKALDLPYSFYDESFTNFFGSRAAWLHYARSCVDKWSDGIELRRRLTVWRLSLAVLDGEITLPSGWTLRDVKFEWVPRGMPWWDPSKEINGDVQAILAGLDNPQRICRERGRGDAYRNIDRISEMKAYAEKKGVALSFVFQPAPAVEVKENA